MSRPISFLLAASLAAGSIAATVAPAAAGPASVQSQLHNGIVLVERDQRRNWNNEDDDWRWNRHHHHRHYQRDYSPGFSFNFGVPGASVYIGPQPYRDCYRAWNGGVYCRN